MKKYTTIILAVFLLTAIIFGAVKQIQINNLNKSIKNAEIIMVYDFFNGTNLEYSIDQMQNNPSKENANVITRQLTSIQQHFTAIFTLNESKINIETMQKLNNNMTSNSCINFILSIGDKKTLDQKDKENLNKLREAYKNFYHNVHNDCAPMTGVTNINSLVGSYVDFIKEIENIPSSSL